MLLTLSLFKTYSQEYVIEHCLENRTFSTNSGLICSNEDRDKWFSIQILYKSNVNYPIVDGFSVMKLNIGPSNNGDLLVFTFTDESTIKVKARTGLLENQTIEFNLTNRDIGFLLSKSVVSIRYINGSNYKSLTYYTTEIENVFFLKALNFYRLKRIDCN